MTALAPPPGAGTDRAAWTRTVFAQGDYAGAALHGDAATWEHHAARALLCGDGRSLGELAAHGGDEARLHLGAALWIHGEEPAALAALRPLALPHAQTLARLIERPRIRVLAQLPWLRGTNTDLLTAAAEDPRFEVRNVSHHPEDVQNRPYASVQRFLDRGFVPDFYVCAMVEWHHLPPDLQRLPCPILGHVADHDLHVQTLQPWLPLFDELLVTDRTEWLDVQGLAAVRVSSFPKVFGLPPLPEVPPAGERARPLDFFVSGTMLDPFHPDKARLLHELLAMPGIELRVVHGFAGAAAYQALLAATKVSFTYVRRPGALPTRGLEALAMGCAVAVQRESVLNLFAGEREGVAGYGPEPGSLAACVRRILDSWDAFGPAALRGAEVVRREFDRRRVAAQYLRFCAFRAAAPRPPRRPADTARLCQKRLCVRRTWLPDSALVRRRTMQANFHFLREQLAAAPAAATLNDLARELLCEFAACEHAGEAGAAERALLEGALALLRRGLRLHPRHLVLRFNLIRAALHHGTPAEQDEALALAAEALARPVDHWEVAPLDDVMPFDFHADGFDYRGHLTRVARCCRGEPVPADELARPILAAIAGCLGRHRGEVAVHERAVALDPGFAPFRLDLARALLARGTAADRERARALLVELAAGSVVFAAAAELLAVLEPAAAGARSARRLREDALDAGVELERLFAADGEALARSGRARVAAVGGSSTGGLPRLSVLVPGPLGERELCELLTDLQAQTLATELEVVVAAAADRAPGQGLDDVLAECRRAGTPVRTAAVAGDPCHAAALNASVAAARAPLLTVAMAGDRFRADAFALLCGELDEDPGAALACANEGFAARTTGAFLPEALAAIRCLPAFAPRRLFARDCIGLRPVWRRELHLLHGGFDAAAGAAAEYEFWLRATARATVRQRREVLSTGLLGAAWRRRRDPLADPDGAARVRSEHWMAGWGPLPALLLQGPLPAPLFAPGLGEEARSHARLGMLSPGAQRRVLALEALYGTAMVHGDLLTARLLLETCTAEHPGLLSARLALAGLCTALGDPAGRAVLAGALSVDPRRERVMGLLGRGSV